MSELKFGRPGYDYGRGPETDIMFLTQEEWDEIDRKNLADPEWCAQRDAIIAFAGYHPEGWKPKCDSIECYIKNQHPAAGNPFHEAWKDGLQTYQRFPENTETVSMEVEGWEAFKNWFDWLRWYTRQFFRALRQRNSYYIRDYWRSICHMFSRYELKFWLKCLR